MGKIFDIITPETADWIRNQKLFFVATAPLSPQGHVNCSPKGLDTFRIIDEKTVAYQDLTGSGAETIAHLRENGRITILYCSFEGPPKIRRLYGRGESIVKTDPRFGKLASLFPPHRGTRSIILVQVNRIQDSCGFGVPLYDYKGEREQLDNWTDHKSDDELESYQREKNSRSIDGLSGL
jgi:hypothetical protein